MGDGATLVIVPVLDRPHRVAPLIASLEAATAEPHRLLFVCTEHYVAEIAAIDAAGAERIVLAANPVGDYAIKINTAYQRSAEEFLFCGADDLDFHDGWLIAALEAMADPMIGVVGTNDLGNERVMAGIHSTHSLVRRSYVDEHGTIDEPGKVLHEGYVHEYVDDEFVQTAQYRGAFAFSHSSIVEHLHPNWAKAPTDAIYDEQPRRMRQGRRLYWRREHMWTR